MIQNNINYPITGLAFQPHTGILLGSTGNSPAATAGLLVKINPLTAEVLVIGPVQCGTGQRIGYAGDNVRFSL